MYKKLKAQIPLPVKLYLLSHLLLVKALLASPSTLWKQFRYYKLARKLELFEPKYYGEISHKLHLSPFKLFLDYVDVSKYSNVNPSPCFDTETYFRSNVDTFIGGESPLIHYLVHGIRECRPISNAVDRWSPERASIIEPMSSEDKLEANEIKIAIVIHIFYEDFVSSFSDMLKKFPLPFDLFISYNKEFLETTIVEAFNSEKIVNLRKTHCYKAENKGRNFGTLLVDMADQLIDYDLMCHVHSKKSLYSGREQTQWSDYNNKYLLDDEFVLNNILQIFFTNDDIGLYFPTPFWMMPSWVNHWTCNKPLAKPFAEKYGVSLNGDFVSYPVGSMFWTRPKAIRQLLEHGFSYSDFPEEPLPADGTILHAIERIVKPLAKHNGYKTFYYYPPKGIFTTDQSYMYIQYRQNLDFLSQSILNHSTVSFDLFDTLIKREYYYPDFAKLLLGSELTAQGLVDSAEQFLEIRNSSEAYIRKSIPTGQDVNIDEIYMVVTKRLGLNSESAMSIANREFELDLEQLSPKEEMIDLFNSLVAYGRKMLIVSDSYYRKDQIELIMRCNRISTNCTLYVSSDIGLRKDIGNIWPFIIKEKKLSHPGDMIHIGDNVRSDAQIPGDFGIATIHILNPYDKWLAVGMNDVCVEDTHIHQRDIIKWGPLISSLGSYPFFY